MDFIKNKMLMAASLFAAATVFGQPNNNCKPACEPCNPCEPHQLLQCPTMGAYVAPARIDIQCGWDVSVDASFIYWQPIQENLELGMENSTAPVAGSFATNGVNGNMINMDFKYKPGFQVGLGYSTTYDNWDFYAEYTWFHSTHHRSTSLSTGQIFPHFSPSGAIFTAFYFNSANQSWKLKFDSVDVDMGRWMYYGTQFTARPSAGARAAWIRQNLSTQYVNLGNLGVGGAANTQQINQRSTSWGIGPRVGLDTNWNFGEGFRFFANGAADVLFTRYNHITYSASNTAFSSIVVHQKKLNSLRTHIDLDLGLGWSTYLDCHKWHLDLSAGYEFQVFFDQNMFRRYSNTSMFPNNSSDPNGNLYVHGLTAKAKLDF